MIPFNKPHLTGKETQYIHDAVYNQGHISGNGKYTKMCQSFFEEKFGFAKCLLTTSCTDALEMAALLMNIQPGDEIIVPSFTFVSTALAFVRQGANIVYCDSRSDYPGIDEGMIEPLISPKTKAIVVVHYAGIATNMDKVLAVANKHKLLVIEDAAQAIDSYYDNKPLGSFGHLACFSFHETKNISSGEGGMLVINDHKYNDRAEILWEKGTNRTAFFRGQIDKYGWVDTGSSFLPSDLIAAFLYAQLEELDKIQARRREIWNIYYDKLSPLANTNSIKLPKIPNYASNNGHMFYIVSNALQTRTKLIDYLKLNNVLSVFHYQSLHRSQYYNGSNGQQLPLADMYSDCLLRLPLYYDLTNEDINTICSLIKNYFMP